MTVSKSNRSANIVRAVAPLAVIACAGAVLLLFPPEQYSFYPQCPIDRYLHLRCPGCGTTRALAALLHGHFIEALRFNPLTTLLMPLAAIYAALCYRSFVQRRSFPRLQPSSFALYATLASVVMFTIARNLEHF